jgi:hypothetical protein
LVQRSHCRGLQGPFPARSASQELSAGLRTSLC